MKPTVLCATPMMASVIRGLEDAYDLKKLYKADDKAGYLAEVGPAVRGMATAGGADASLMDACPNLEIISSFGVGYDSVDIPHAQQRGIVVCNTPDVLNDEVANTAVLLLLTAARRFVEYDRYVRDGRWVPEGDPPLTTSVAGKRVGIVGLGRIGKAIAAKLAVFHCEIAYYGRRRQPDVAFPYYDDLPAMARDCYALIVITPGGAETRHLIDRPVLDALGPEGLLINVSRGSVVDEAALIEALRDGRLGRAALDVFEREPHVPPELIAMDNVVLQPHQGSATVETRQAMGQRVLDNLAEYFAGRPPLSRVV